MALALTPDGLFHTSEDPRQIDGELCFPGTMVVDGDPGIFRDADRTHVLGRSGTAQVGLDIESPNLASAVFKDGKIEVPVHLKTYGGLQLLDEIMEAVTLGTTLRVGRLLSLNDTAALDETKMEDALKQKDVKCVGERGRDWRVNEDGSISVRLDAGAYIHNERALKEPGALQQILMHGRDGINRLQDFEERGPSLIKPSELFVGGIRFSTGKYSALIRPEITDTVKHLKGGLFLDAFRSTRLNSRYGSSALRQVELVNTGQSNVERESVWITLDIYPSSRDGSSVAKKVATLDEKEFMHEHGVSFLQATNLESAQMCDLLFDNVSAVEDEDELYGRVITRNGVTPIAWARTEKFQSQDNLAAVENTAGERNKDERFEPFIDGLGETKDQGRVLVTNGLPSSDQLRLLVDRGVRAFVFKEVRPRGRVNKTKNHESRNIYLDPHLHQELTKLENEGVSFTFICEVDEKEQSPVREFYKGFWCKPEAKQKLDKVEVVIDMYGWHKDKVSDMCETDVRQFFTDLIKVHGKESLAVATGIGPGFMDLADRIAKELGIFTFGVGIDVEEKGQMPSVNVDAMLHFDSTERGYRQKILDELGVAKIFNIGGFGTSEESWITCCSTKLGEYLPMPLLFIDGSDGDHLWESNKRQAEVISNTTEFKFGKDENVVDLQDYKQRLGNAWVSNIINCVDSYTAAMGIWSEFVKDPLAYWQEAGVPSDELFYAYENHKTLASRQGRPMPEFLVRAMEKLGSEIKSYDRTVVEKWNETAVA